MGFYGSRFARLSKHFPTTLPQPEIVTENLAKKAALGRTAGPFSTPPFPYLQVSLLGLVPREHSSFERYVTYPFPSLGLQDQLLNLRRGP